MTTSKRAGNRASRTRSVWLGSLVLLVCASFFAAPSAAQEGAAETAHRVELEGLTLIWTEAPESLEVAVLTDEARHFYDRVAEFLGEAPNRTITIVFGGPAERPGGAWEYPRVDREGRVLVFRFVPDFRNYLTALAHEMVHAFRFDRRRGADWFFEEGFAEFVSLRVDPSLAGFPWFDYPVALVAGQWLARNEAIPLTLLHRSHRTLNRRCQAQSYALRSAFFDWLGRTLGDETVLAASRPRPAGTGDAYETFFGETLETLETRWREEQLEAYRAMADADSLADAYRTRSPIQYQNVCSEGEDF